MERDEALLRKVGDVIANEPERYSQHEWFTVTECGTTACVAGFVAMAHPEFEQIDVDPDEFASGIVVIGGQRHHVSYVAGELIGLDHYERVVLFDPDWEPAGDPSVPVHERVKAALYALSEGATVKEVSA